MVNNVNPAALVDGANPAISAGPELRLPKLSHMVAARLREQIASGKIKAGSQLLPENQLVELFNVSRPTVREALRVLEAESLISIGRGMRNGATVLTPSIGKATEYATTILVHDGVTMSDLHEARLFMEPAIVLSLRGEKVKTAAIKLRSCIDHMTAALQEEQFLDVLSGTNRFHEELARASGNKTIAILIGMLQSISDEVYAATLVSNNSGSRAAIGRNMEKTVAGYSVLCDLLEKGKTDEAASFWRRYMERAGEFLAKSGLGRRRLVISDGAGTLSDRGE